MKMKLLAVLLAGMILLTACGFVVVDDDAETVLGSIGVAHGEEALDAAEYSDTQIQERLIELGFLAGKADGYFGPKSTAALKAFQEFCGFEATGEKDEKTLGMLFGDPAALPTPSPTPIAKGARDGEDADVIKKLQERLQELNYLSGKADGIFGPGTESALKSFQELNGLEITGMADEDTMAALNAAQAVPMPTPEPTPRVRGAKGEEIKLIQEALQQMGFMGGNADGDFGPETEASVKRYQTYVHEREEELAMANPTPSPTPSPEPTPSPVPTASPTPEPEAVVEIIGGEEDGEPIDVPVIEMTEAPVDEPIDMPVAEMTEAPVDVPAEESKDEPVEEVSDVPIDEPIDEPIGEPVDATAEPEATEEPYEPDGIVTDELMADILALNDVVLYSEDLERGSSGDEVIRLQRRLASLWYLSNNTVDIDGQFGPKTENAIKYLQKRNNLEETGKADKELQLFLYGTEVVKSDRPTCMYKLKVSVDDQRVYAYKWVNGEYTELARTMICSTGTVSDPTPLGTFTAGGPCGSWYYFQKFDCWAKYAYRINGPYLFHSVIYSEKDESTLRQGSVNALGSRASHGCVRLKVEDAKWIYNNCPAGTTVVVY